MLLISRVIVGSSRGAAICQVPVFMDMEPMGTIWFKTFQMDSQFSLILIAILLKRD